MWIPGYPRNVMLLHLFENIPETPPEAKWIWRCTWVILLGLELCQHVFFSKIVYLDPPSTHENWDFHNWSTTILVIVCIFFVYLEGLGIRAGILIYHISCHVGFPNQAQVETGPGAFQLQHTWLVVEPPLWKIWKSVGQLGWWHSQYDGKDKTCSKPPTRYHPVIRHCNWKCPVCRCFFPSFEPQFVDMEDVFSGQPCLMTIWDILQKFVFGILSYHEPTASPTQQLRSHFFLEPSIPKQPRPAWVSWESPRVNDGWPMCVLSVHPNFRFLLFHASCVPNLSNAARPNMWTVAWILLKIDPTTPVWWADKPASN